MLYLRRPGRLVFLARIQDEEYLTDLWRLLQEDEFQGVEGLDA